MENRLLGGRLVDDLYHLREELCQVAQRAQLLPRDSQDWSNARRVWVELNDTYGSKYRQLCATGLWASLTLAPMPEALALAETSWATSEAALRVEGMLPLNPVVVITEGMKLHVTQPCYFCEGDSYVVHPLWKEYNAQLGELSISEFFFLHGYLITDKLPEMRIPCQDCNGTGEARVWLPFKHVLKAFGLLGLMLYKFLGGAPL